MEWADLMGFFKPNIQKLQRKRDIPKLLDALIQDRMHDFYITDEAADALAEIGEDAIEPLCITLQDKTLRTRRYVIDVLGKIGSPVAIESIISAASDDKLRSSAVQALGEIGDISSIPFLCEALKDGDRSVRIFAARSLGAIANADAVDSLCNALKNLKGPNQFQLVFDFKGEERFAISVVEALDNIGGPKAMSCLNEALKSDFEKVVFYSAKSLKRNNELRDDETICEEILKKRLMLKEHISELFGLSWLPDIEDSMMRLNKLAEFTRNRKLYNVTLSTMFSSEFAKNIQEILRIAIDGKEDERSQANLALIELLDNYLRSCDASNANYVYAIRALVEIEDSRAIDALISALGHENKYIRAAAAGALGKADGSRAEKYLLQAINDGFKDVRVNAVESLASINSTASVSGLLNAAKDSSWAVRKKVVAALGQYKEKEVEESLMHALSDPNVGVRIKAQTSLDRIGYLIN